MQYLHEEQCIGSGDYIIYHYAKAIGKPVLGSVDWPGLENIKYPEKYETKEDKPETGLSEGQENQPDACELIYHNLARILLTKELFSARRGNAACYKNGGKDHNSPEEAQREEKERGEQAADCGSPGARSAGRETSDTEPAECKRAFIHQIVFL